MLLTYKENVHSTQMYIPLKPLFSRHKGIGVQFTDEPTGNLDENTAQEIMELLKECAHQMNKCVVLVTHSNELAKEADIIFHLKRGTLQGTENKRPTPEEYTYKITKKTKI